MKISLSGGNTGARKWQDAIIFSKGGKMTWATPSGESTLTRTKHTGNAAYAGADNFEVKAETIIFIKDCGEYYRAELLKGDIPNNFPEKIYTMPGPVARKFNMICRSGILKDDTFEN